MVDPPSLSLSLRLNCQDYPYVNTFLYRKLRVVVPRDGLIAIRRLRASLENNRRGMLGLPWYWLFATLSRRWRLPLTFSKPFGGWSRRVGIARRQGRSVVEEKRLPSRIPPPPGGYVGVNRGLCAGPLNAKENIHGAGYSKPRNIDRRCC